MVFKLDDLKAACFEVAQNAKWDLKPQLVSDIQSLANKFYEKASERAKEINEIEEDSEIVNRAVWYLSQVHAIPPMKDDVRWFNEMLEVLLELALPNTYVAVGKPQQFLQDLIRGITWSIENPFDPDKT
ncbi:MAG: hypothetical protein HZB81_06155 [Deltaproteobacteria bacterium]|nr:hypothetical protein [Deltaproteobacteria bacterium]